MLIKFSVNTTPLPQPRPRFARGHAYEPPNISVYKQLIQYFAKAHMLGKEPIAGLVFVCVSFRRNVKLGSRKFGDIDNHLKAVLDALNGICYTDDSLVVKLFAEKLHSKDEGVDIIVSDQLNDSGGFTFE